MEIFFPERCAACGGTMRRETAELQYDYGDIQLTVRGVPVAVCEHCGERYVPGEIGVLLGEHLERLVVQLRATLDADAAIQEPRLTVSVDPERLLALT